MQQRSKANDVAAIGLDLGDRWSQLAVISSDGRVAREGRVAMSAESLRKEFGDLPRTRVVIEAGTHSPWVSRALEQLGHEVIVANSRKLPLIYGDTCKSDRRDAVMLARLGRMDPALLSPIRHRGVRAQADLAVIRARDALVRARTMLINHLRGAVKAFGGRLPSRSSASLHKDASEFIPTELQAALKPLLQSLAMTSCQIREYDRTITRAAQRSYPETAQLYQVCGVGWLTALAYVLTLDDPRRFKRSRTVGAFLGLAVREHSSGSSNPELGITKAGDRSLRRLLVQCAHYILGRHGQDCDLRRFGLALLARGGKAAKKKAVVAVARKLAVLLHRLWITGEVYEPLRHAKQRGEVVGKAA